MATKPVQEIRLGRIRASVWPNRGDEHGRHKVFFTRLQRTGKRWQDTAVFSPEDLPLLVELAHLVDQWMRQENPP